MMNTNTSCSENSRELADEELEAVFGGWFGAAVVLLSATPPKNGAGYLQYQLENTNISGC